MTKRVVECGEHGKAVATFVCRHLAAGTGLIWYSAGDPNDEDPWPDAWCEKCESVRIAHGGDWNEDSEAFAQSKLLCSGCYETRKRAVEQDSADDSGIELRYLCGSCDQVHEGFPAWSARYPAPYLEVPEDERPQRTFLNEDLCVVDDEDYFVLGNIEIPILEHVARLSFGVWVSLSKANFERTISQMDDARRIHEPPYFGWLCNRLPVSLFPDTLLLKTHVFQRSVGKRPLIALEPTDHPLSVAQHNGVSVEYARSIVEKLLATQGGRVA